MGTINFNQSDSMCRACLKSGAKNHIFAIHKRSAVQYSYILSSCTSIQVEPGDNLPTHICRKCLNILIRFYTFKNTVVQNDLRLRQGIKDKIRGNAVTDIHFAVQGDENAREQSEFKLVIVDKSDSFESTPTVTISTKNLATDELGVKHEIKTELKNEPNEDVSKSEARDYFSDDDDVFEESDPDESKEKPGRGKIDKNKAHQCEVCGKIFSCNSNLQQHLRRHTGERPYTCDNCGKKFFKTEHLVIHKRTHTGERPHHCNICPKKFIQCAALKAHLRTHSGERPHMCSVCGKSFSQTSSLAYHMRIHSGEMPYKCKLCGKGFKNSGNLNIHMRFHDNDRRFACKICDKRFVTSSHLNTHVKQHNGEKSHQCIVCGKAFVRSEHLKGHLVIHTGQKPHACKLCPKKYTQTSHLRRHMKSHKSEL